MIGLALYPSEISHAAFVFDSFLELFQNPLELYSNIGLINVKFSILEKKTQTLLW